MTVRAVAVLVDAPISDAVVTIVVEVATIAHHVMIEQCNMLLITDHFKAFEGTPIPMDISKIMVDTATKTSSEEVADATNSPIRDVETQDGEILAETMEDPILVEAMVEEAPILALRTITIPISLTTKVEEDQMMALRTITIPSSLTTEMHSAGHESLPFVYDTVHGVERRGHQRPLIDGPNPDEATDHGFGRRTPMVVTTSSLTLAFFFLGRTELEIFKIQFLEETNWRF